MYGDLASRLAIDAKRSQSLDTLPVYSDLIPAITREIKSLDSQVSAALSQFENPRMIREEDPSASCAVLIQHLSMRRNKRCLLAYHKVRTNRIENEVWNGNVNKLSENLSPQEIDYSKRYAELLANIKGKWTDIDLTASLESTQELFIDVRVLKDAGEIQTEYGTISLTKNSTFYVRAADVHRLIQQGFLQQL